MGSIDCYYIQGSLIFGEEFVKIKNAKEKGLFFCIYQAPHKTKKNICKKELFTFNRNAAECVFVAF